MNAIGLIPARGGSKGVPKKSITLCAGKPLLSYTAQAALGSKLHGKVYLSTDDEEIAKVGESCGVKVPFLRPAEIARDDTPMIAVLQHALQELEPKTGKLDALVLLQPTSPLRTSKHIDEALELFITARADSVVSVQEVPHQFNPISVMNQDKGGFLSQYLEISGPAILRRQDKPRVFARNGPAILILRPELVRSGTLYGSKTAGYLMDKLSSIDVDDRDDLRIVEAILNQTMLFE